MKKATTKILTSFLVIVLAVVMLFNVTTDALGGTAEAAAYIKQITSVDTNYKDFLDGSVVQKLPSTEQP